MKLNKGNLGEVGNKEGKGSSWVLGSPTQNYVISVNKQRSLIHIKDKVIKFSVHRTYYFLAHSYSDIQ